VGAVGPVLEKACGPRLIGVIPTGEGMAVDNGGCGVPRDKDEVMEVEDRFEDRLLLDDGSETCSKKFARA
jgi:hypothetical protein